MRLKDVLKITESGGNVCISRPDYDKGEGYDVVFLGELQKMEYWVVRPFLDYKVTNIMAGSKEDGIPGVLYIDIQRPTDKEFMI